MEAVGGDLGILLGLLQLISGVQYDGEVDRLHRRTQNTERVFAGAADAAGIRRRGAMGQRAVELFGVILEHDDRRGRAGLLRLKDDQGAFQ
jgi:hypothetical protein